MSVRPSPSIKSEEVARFEEDALGLVAKREEGFFATCAAALLGYGEDFVGSHEMRAGLAGVFAEGAVAAVVAAEIGERDENFSRVGDDAGLELVFCGVRGG